MSGNRSSLLTTRGPGRIPFTIVSAVVLVLLGALTLFSLQAAAGPDPAGAKRHQRAKRVKPTRVKLKIATGSQAAVLNRRQVRVRARASGRARVRLTGPGLRPAIIRFGPRVSRVRTVTLRVRRPGWINLATCGAKRLAVAGTWVQRVRRRGRPGRRLARSRSARRLKPDRSLCGQPPACDPLDPALCLLPWPNNHFTRPDGGNKTGMRLDLADEMMPANFTGKHIEAAAWNEADGFSPGQPIITKVPGLDNAAALTATDAAPINSIGEFARPGAPIVLIEAGTGERVPLWAELDSTSATDADRLLQINPALNLKPATRYIVAMRNLRRADGGLIPAPAYFRAYRDMARVNDDPAGRRRAGFERIFRDLGRAGIGRGNLYLAWDFTVASDHSLTSRLLTMRDESFRDLDDTDLANRVIEGDAPDFDVQAVETFNTTQNPRIAREIRGMITVPCYLWPDCEMQTGSEPAGSFRLDRDSLPIRNSDKPMQAAFTCIVPRASEQTAARPSLYGHGLFSDREEVTIRPHQNLAQNHNMVLCATDQISLTTAEMPHVIGIVEDFSRFPEITDGTQQGMLNELYLGRAMVHPDGFSVNEEFHVDGDLSKPAVIDTDSRLSYSGYSMGGIMGGMLTAVSPDLDRAVLGVPGIRFSLLLPRSSYWITFGGLIKAHYPADIETPLVLSLLQSLWDRGEGNGYARRMTSDPLPDTPPHEVLLSTAFGDHQVTNWTTDVLARTVGAKARSPILDPGRWAGVDELWGVPRAGSWPLTGSTMVMWDIGPVRGTPSQGVPSPPLTNTPNLGGEDPHDMIWDMPDERAMVSDFLGPDATFDDPCPSQIPCYAGTWHGPDSP